MNNELIKEIDSADSAVEFFKLKGNILDAFGNAAYAKKLKGIESVVDFYAERSRIINELSGTAPAKPRGV